MPKVTTKRRKPAATPYTRSISNCSHRKRNEYVKRLRRASTAITPIPIPTPTPIEQGGSGTPAEN